MPRRKHTKTPLWVLAYAGLNALARMRAVQEDHYAQDLRNQDLRAKIAGRAHDNRRKSLQVQLEQERLEHLRLQNAALAAKLDQGSADPVAGGIPVKRCADCGGLAAQTFTTCPTCGGNLTTETLRL